MPDEHTDWSLVEQVKAGNDGAFDALMARYKRPVLNFVYRMIGDAGEAEDLAQDVFVRAYRNMKKPRFRRSAAAFSTWLFQVARSAALDRLRRRKRRPVESQATRVKECENTAVTSRTVDKEIGERIAAAVAMLPEDRKTIFILSEYQELSYAKIAAVMQCSIKFVEALAHFRRVCDEIKEFIEGLPDTLK